MKKLIYGILLLSLLFGCVQSQNKESLPRDLEIILGEGHTYVSDGNVTLNLFARNAFQCRFSEDGENWGPWEPYAKQRAWQLSQGDGPKEVFYQCSNYDGFLSVPVSTTVFLDSTPPSISLSSPSEGAIYPTVLDLVFNVSDPGSNTVDCHSMIDGKRLQTDVVATDIIHTINIGAEPGDHSLSLECSDKIHSSNITVSFRTVKRPKLKLSINNGTKHTSSRNVTLNLESDGTECRFSRNSVEWTDWASFSSVVPWELRKNDGLKAVYAQCRDAQGVISETVKDTITLDTRPPPYISVSINNDASWTGSRNVSLGLYAFGASQCRFSNDGESWSGWEEYSQNIAWELAPGEGTKSVYYTCRNEEGTDIGVASSSISYSASPNTPPIQMGIMINKGAAYASSDILELSLSASGAYECRFREGSLNWTSWEDYSPSRSFIVSGKDEAKVIYYQCRNDRGSSSAFDMIFLDRNPPGAPPSLKAVAGPYSVALRWGGATDIGSGVQHYLVYRQVDSIWKWMASTEGLSHKDELVISGETYRYKVRAIDFNGNLGPDSDTISITIPEE